jgi:hypothetical protein
MNRKEKKIKIGQIEYTESELYENEDDRNRILSLNELERETILSERVQKLIQEKERAALLKQKSETNNKIRKKDALEEIKLRKEKAENIKIPKETWMITPLPSQVNRSQEKLTTKMTCTAKTRQKIQAMKTI